MKRWRAFYLCSVIMITSISLANADEVTTIVSSTTTVTVVPNSTVVTVLPGSTVTMPAGVSIPAGATLIAPPGNTTSSTTSTTSTTTTETGKFEVDMNNLSALTPEQRAALEVAMAKAEASAPSSQSTSSSPNIPSAISGLTPEMLKHLTPEQLKLVEQAKATGTIPGELKGMLSNISDIPGDVYAKLSDQQKSILDSARASGVLDRAMINDIVDGLTAAEVKAFTSGQSISTNAIQKAAAKRTITCVSGKKTVTLVATACPKGYKKK